MQPTAQAVRKGRRIETSPVGAKERTNRMERCEITIKYREPFSSPVHKHRPVRLARRPDRNLNVLAKSGQEIHQPFHRKRS